MEVVEELKVCVLSSLACISRDQLIQEEEDPEFGGLY